MTARTGRQTPLGSPALEGAASAGDGHGPRQRAGEGYLGAASTPASLLPFSPPPAPSTPASSLRSLFCQKKKEKALQHT